MLLATLYKDDESKVRSLISGFVKYVKNLSLFNHVVVKKTDNSNTTTKATTENVKPVERTTTAPEEATGSRDLFPKKIVIDERKLSESSAVACSTNGHAKLIKIDNEDGSVSWKFDGEAGPTSVNQAFSAITSPFLSSGSTVSSTFSPANGLGFFGQKDSPSPFSMTTTNNNRVMKQEGSDVDSTHSLESELAALPNPEFFDIDHTNHEDDDLDDLDEEEDDSNEESGSDKGPRKGKKSYNCEFCGAEFRIRGYLTRHVKKHALTKAYECPFYYEHAENKCHPTGGFSRRDTYKTHLKARHFKYPQGTRSQDRANTSGKCGICSKPYETNEEWVEKHIEGGQCDGLPNGYTARVKNSRRKNYEYPNPLQISPVSSNSNDSPVTVDGSPAVQHQLHQHQEQLQHQQQQELGSMTDPFKIVAALNTNQVYNPQFKQEFNEYDNNDEFSLDVEQSNSFRPLVHTQGYGF